MGGILSRTLIRNKSDDRDPTFYNTVGVSMVGITIVGWEGIPHNSMCSANLRLPSMRGAAVVLAGRLIHLVLEDGEFRRFLGAHRQGGLQFATQLRGMDGGLGLESFSRSGRQLVRSALEFRV